MASLGILTRHNCTLNRLCKLYPSQYITQISRCNVSLHSVFHQNNRKNKEGNTYEDGYRRYNYSNPVERTFVIMKDDLKIYFKEKWNTIQKIKNLAKQDIERKSNEKPAAQDNVYNYSPDSSKIKSVPWPGHCDVLVVGGGAVGSSVAYHLKEKARDGLNVVVVEKDITFKQSSTVLSVGGIRQQFSIPENILLSQFGMDFLRKSPEILAMEGMDPPNMQFNPSGYVTLATEQGYEQLKKNYQTQLEVGAKVSLLFHKELSKMYPWLNTSGVVAGILGRENEGWFDPWSLLIGLQRKAVSLGAHYVNGEVTGFDHCDPTDAVLEGMAKSNIRRLQSAEVTLPNGEKRKITFAILVVATGASTGQFGKLMGIGVTDGLLKVPIPIEPRKRYVYCVHAPDGPGLNFPFLIDPSGAYVRREGLGGLFLCGQSPTEDKEPPVDNLDVDYTFFEEQVWPTIANRVPSFENLKLHSAWAGFYDYNTFDQNGIVGPHPLFTNLYIASGFSGHGIQQAPGVGLAIAECIILGKYHTINLERFSFERVLVDEPLYEANVV